MRNNPEEPTQVPLYVTLLSVKERFIHSTVCPCMSLSKPLNCIVHLKEWLWNWRLWPLWPDLFTYMRACIHTYVHVYKQTNTHKHTPFVRSFVHLFIPLIPKFAKITVGYGVSEKYTNFAKYTELLQYSCYKNFHIWYYGSFLNVTRQAMYV
jgi:hypothetical protein